MNLIARLRNRVGETKRQRLAAIFINLILISILSINQLKFNTMLYKGSAIVIGRVFSLICSSSFSAANPISRIFTHRLRFFQAITRRPLLL